MFNSIRSLLVAALLSLALDRFAHAHPAGACARACAKEDEPVVESAALVQPALLSGPNFKVDSDAEVRGYMARFTITTSFGLLTADSAELLAVRVNEIPSLEALDRASKSAAFAHAIAERGKKTGTAIVHVIAHPVDTVAGLPAGVARYLRKQLDTWGDRGLALSDRSSRVFENKGDPYHAPPGPMTAGREERDDDKTPGADKKNRAWYARLGNEAEREAKRYLKYSEQRREITKALGIDPNSTNPIMNEKLDALAWAAVGGNFSAGTALGTITGSAATVISDTGTLNKLVWQLDPEQLREVNRTRLLKFCSDDFAVRQFLRRGGFTDSLRTSLADALEKLQPSSGCNELIELGATTRGEVEARYLVDALRMILRNAPESTGGELIVAGAALLWRTPDGKLLLPLPVDYLTWSHDIDDFFDQPVFAVREKSVLVGGEASMEVQRKLTERGWSLVLRASYEGAPAYANDGEFAP